MQKHSFAKLVCGGNDFIVIDHRQEPLPHINPADIARLCHRNNGVGADGVIFMVDNVELPFSIKLFNADGSFAEVSYNGSRCVAMYAIEHQICSENFSFGSDAGEISVKVTFNEVLLDVPSPRNYQRDLKLTVAGEQIPAHYIEAGVPYLVLFTDEIEMARALKISAVLKTNPYFPAGTNVAVAEPAEGSICKARFFERGVDEETDSSGTGCVAVALLAQGRYGLSSPVTIRSAGGDFEIEFSGENNDYYDISTSGLVSYLFDGTTKG